MTIDALKNMAYSSKIIARFITLVFPLVSSELDDWRKFAASAPEPALSAQALASIRDKKFHCQGGSIYSLYPGVSTAGFVRLVVALQTISDYLDNLCDRAGIADEYAFRRLHLAMTDALDPGRRLQDYYAGYPFRQDGGYLRRLVEACREEVRKLPSYHMVKDDAIRLATLYSDLQTYKHLDPAVREEKMLTWTKSHLASFPEISPWEFAAASGSTLGIFVLCACAASPTLQPGEARRILTAYFPWLCGLHILLDYFIDSNEDKETGDLNFVAYYGSNATTLERLAYFVRQSLAHARALPNPAFHKLITHGLLAMYLSDPKAEAETAAAVKAAMLKEAGCSAKILHTLCRLLRAKKIL